MSLPYPIKVFDPTPPPSSRREGRSTDGSISSRGKFGISNVQDRVGAPPLRPLPLETSFTSEVIKRLSNNQQNAIRAGVEKRLARQIPGIEFIDGSTAATQVEIVTRKIPGADDSEKLTIFIQSPWRDDAPATWHRAVKLIKIWIDDFLDKHFLGDIDAGVEMISQELQQPKYVSPILNKPDLEANWDQIRSYIRDILGSFDVTKHAWTCIALFRYGPSDNYDENPPTVFISVTYKCHELTWAPVRNKITSYLNDLSYGLHLKIEHDASHTHVFELVTPKSMDTMRRHPRMIRGPYPSTVDIGSDIGPCLYTMSDSGRPQNPGLGTLGCYVQVKLTGNGSWQTFALTNYHVIRSGINGFRRTDEGSLLPPDKDSQLYLADHQGILPGTAPALQMESPSRAKHNYTIAVLDRVIKQAVSGPLSRGVADRAEKAAFFDRNEQHLGSVWAGSGFAFRTTSGAMLDWALIEVKDSRRGKNTLPSDVEDMMVVPPANIWGVQLRKLAPAHEFKLQKATYKIGAITKVTSGMLSTFKADVRYGDWTYMSEEGFRYTTEVMFHGYGGDPVFADHGDSGSVVYTTEGKALGMIFRGISPDKVANGGTPCTYVTPLHDVFEHIKVFLKDQISDIRIAENLNLDKGNSDN